MTILWIELELFPAEKSFFQFIFSGEPDAESTFAKSLFLGGFKKKGCSHLHKADV